MDWGRLLKPTRFGWKEGSTQEQETRSHFQRDYDRIIFSSPFRRLQNKTQVFPLPGSVFVHNRLTHSLEVASVGRSLGNNLITFLKQNSTIKNSELIDQIPTIVSTACLAHDLGNPPFGHSGEDAIRSYFKNNEKTYRALLNEEEWNDLIRFEGNANAFRLLTQKMEGKREGGFRLSYPALSSIVKYPWESTLPHAKKFGFFQSEKNFYIEIAQGMGIPIVNNSPLAYARHPLVYLVEAADDICYQIMDIEDAHKLGILSTTEVKDLFLAFFDPDGDKHWLENIDQTLNDVADKNEKIAFLRAMTIGKLTKECSQAFERSYIAIMNGEKTPSLINQLSKTGSLALKRVKDVSVEKVYNHRTVVEIELAGFQIINSLLNKICPALMNPNDDYSKKVHQLIPNQYIPKDASTYLKLMAAVDFVSGMTDIYALELYQTFEGITIPGINR
ncbi:MAG: deoxyguanosinetriphosphate triphosphohydrolase [Bacteroidetes bacterium HGW-Bacteroidetes-15]|nr:MAG: deoxyguanosinetriphosphate triphosphohydrolase [Bacteroidetes bacterium HGW-Bacteroidetes-15]